MTAFAATIKDIVLKTIYSGGGEMYLYLVDDDERYIIYTRYVIRKRVNQERKIWV